MSYKKQELFILREHVGSSTFYFFIFLVWSVLLIFSVLCSVFISFVCRRSVCPMLPVSLYCSFLIGPSVFSNFYFSYSCCAITGLPLILCFQYFVLSFWNANRESVFIPSFRHSTYSLCYFTNLFSESMKFRLAMYHYRTQ